jgi:hypothetical protein
MAAFLIGGTMRFFNAENGLESFERSARETIRFGGLPRV